MLITVATAAIVVLVFVKEIVIIKPIVVLIAASWQGVAIGIIAVIASFRIIV